MRETHMLLNRVCGYACLVNIGGNPLLTRLIEHQQEGCTQR